MNLEDLGWDRLFRERFEPFRDQGFTPARIARERKHSYLVYTEHGELVAAVSGKMRHKARSKGDFPAVGDWVVIQPRPGEGKATIHTILPRKSKFSRNAVGGRTEEQVVAANVDTVFLVSGLDGVRTFNLRRIERYVVLGWESGAAPVVVLNKMDICKDVEARLREVESVAFGVPIHAVSATERLGLEALNQYLIGGKTVALLGSSGVGKSTLVNSLLGEERQRVREVREDDGRGRHMTAHRELIVLPQGGAVIDSPGMRELQMWTDENGLRRTFDDVEKLARLCRFRDCRHRSEPGCAIRKALEEGTLDTGRWQSYLKLQREVQYLERRHDQKARLAEKAKWKKISQWSRKVSKKRGEMR